MKTRHSQTARSRQNNATPQRKTRKLERKISDQLRIFFTSRYTTFATRRQSVTSPRRTIHINPDEGIHRMNPPGNVQRIRDSHPNRQAPHRIRHAFLTHAKKRSCLSADPALALKTTSAGPHSHIHPAAPTNFRCSDLRDKRRSLPEAPIQYTGRPHDMN